jgi:hypothetical protein
MTILEDIRANQVVDLHLNAAPEEYFGETSDITDALKDNTSIESVQFDKDFIACVYGRERGEILDQVAKLPNLKEVFLGDALLMAEDITSLLKNAKGLKKISLHHLVLQGNRKDFEGLKKAVLYQHGSLKDIQMEDCTASNEDIDVEKIMNRRKNVDASSIDKPIHFIIMTIIEDIRANQVVDLHLNAVPEEYFGETSGITDALKDNTSIESVRFDKDFIACVYGRERGEILDQVAKLPNLKEVFLGDALLMADDITSLLKNAKGLKKITLHRLVLQGTKKDFEGLKKAVLYQHGSLKDFQMEECIPSNEGIDMEKIMNPRKNVDATSSIDKPIHFIIMTIIEDIRANQVVDLHLNAVPEEYFGETSDITDALKDNTSIESVRFDKDFIACVYGREGGELLDQVAKLPNLKEVFLGDALLMADDIASLLKNAKGLKKISLHHLVLQ